MTLLYVLGKLNLEEQVYSLINKAKIKKKKKLNVKTN